MRSFWLKNKKWNKNGSKRGTSGNCEKVHHAAFLMHLRFLIFDVRKKVTFIFLHHGIHNWSKFCFWKCTWMFFCGNLYPQNISRLLHKYCYKVIKIFKAISDSHVSMQMTQCQHTTQKQKMPNVINQHTTFNKSATNLNVAKFHQHFFNISK